MHFGTARTKFRSLRLNSFPACLPSYFVLRPLSRNPPRQYLFYRAGNRYNVVMKIVALRCLALLMTAVGAALAAPPAPTPGDAPKATVWMAPPSYGNGRRFRELFEQPEAWRETRSLIDVLAYTDLNIQRQFSDDQLRTWFPMLRRWGTKFALEVAP